MKITKEKLDENFYSTSDLALAATLNLYYPIKEFNKKNPKRVYFIFKKDKDFDLLMEHYCKGELKVDPQKYFNSLKTLKNMIYSINFHSQN